MYVYTILSEYCRHEHRSRDITHMKFKSKMAENSQRLSQGFQPRTKRARHGVRYQMELNFDTNDDKQALLARLDSVKRSLAPSGSLPLDNGRLLSLLLDKVESETAHSDSTVGTEDELQRGKSLALPMLDNSGLCVMYCTCGRGENECEEVIYLYVLGIYSRTSEQRTLWEQY